MALCKWCSTPFDERTTYDGQQLPGGVISRGYCSKRCSQDRINAAHRDRWRSDPDRRVRKTEQSKRNTRAYRVSRKVRLEAKRKALSALAARYPDDFRAYERVFRRQLRDSMLGGQS